MLHAILWLATVALAVAPVARAQVTGSLTTIGSVTGENGGMLKFPLTIGSDGNLYGTSLQGANYSGTIFRITPGGTVTLLHTFTAATDGELPYCSLLLASDGNFYGVTRYGGSPGSSDAIGDTYGGGTVFRITSEGVFTVLHVFPDDGRQGRSPMGGLVQGTDGALYGVTQLGGAATGVGDDGTFYRITLDGTFTFLHALDYQQTGTGGRNPYTSLVLGSDGNFYGVMPGGDNGNGVVYKLSPDGTVTVLHNFKGSDGSNPLGPLIEDGPGVFYGVTAYGGTAGFGTFFSVTSDGQLTSLHSFADANENGGFLQCKPAKGIDGNFYLPTTYGGNGLGNIFQLTPTGTVTNTCQIHSSTFVGRPFAALALAADGSFYGTTQTGTVYRLVVTPHPPFFNGAVDLTDSVEYLAFPNGNIFGYYEYLNDPHFIYHFDLGFEYVIDSADEQSGVYLYDYTSGDFFYTSPTFPFPYLYDFGLQAFLYYYPDPTNPQRYNTNGVRYFYNFKTGTIITR